MTSTLPPLVVMLLVLLALRFVAWWGLCLAFYLLGKSALLFTYVRSRDDISALGTRLSTSFPKTTSVLQARLTPSRYTGLPLTLVIMVAIYLVALFGGLVEELLEAEELIRFDESVNQSLGSLRTENMLIVFSWITDLGGSVTFVAVAIVATGLLWSHRCRHMIVPLWVTILGSQLITYAGKYVFARERPESVTDVIAMTASFPSGHSTSAMAVYGFIAYVIARGLVTTRQRFEVGYWAAVLICLIGFSRMLLGMHYASDVAAGFLVGGLWLLLGFAFAEHKLRTASAS